MKCIKSLCSAAAVLGLGLMVSSSASAAAFSGWAGNPFTPGPDGVVTYTHISNTLVTMGGSHATASPVPEYDGSTFELTPGYYVSTLEISELEHVQGPYTFEVKYNVSSTAGSIAFEGIDADVAFGDATINKKYYRNSDFTGLITELTADQDNSANGTVNLGSNFYVHVTVTAEDNTILNGFSDTYTIVPEPSSFVLAGLAIAGLGFVHARRRKA